MPNEENNNNVEEEVPEVRLSKKKVGGIVLGILILLAIIISVCMKLTVSKEVKNPQTGQTVSTENQSSSQSISNTGKNEAENAQNVPESGGSTLLGAEENNSKNSEVNNSKNEITTKEPTKEVDDEISNNSSETPKEGAMQEVSEPVLTDGKATTAMVSSKSIFMVDGTSFAYSVDLVVLKGTDDYAAVKYFCPRKTYDALVEGDSVKVEYQVDKDGVISISSVSK